DADLARRSAAHVRIVEQRDNGVGSRHHLVVHVEDPACRTRMAGRPFDLPRDTALVGHVADESGFAEALSVSRDKGAVIRCEERSSHVNLHGTPPSRTARKGMKRNDSNPSPHQREKGSMMFEEVAPSPFGSGCPQTQPWRRRWTRCCKSTRRPTQPSQCSAMRSPSTNTTRSSPRPLRRASHQTHSGWTYGPRHLPRRAACWCSKGI